MAPNLAAVGLARTSSSVEKSKPPALARGLGQLVHRDPVDLLAYGGRRGVEELGADDDGRQPLPDVPRAVAGQGPRHLSHAEDSRRGRPALLRGRDAELVRHALADELGRAVAVQGQVLGLVALEDHLGDGVHLVLPADGGADAGDEEVRRLPPAVERDLEEAEDADVLRLELPDRHEEVDGEGVVDDGRRLVEEGGVLVLAEAEPGLRDVHLEEDDAALVDGGLQVREAARLERLGLPLPRVGRAVQRDHLADVGPGQQRGQEVAAQGPRRAGDGDDLPRRVAVGAAVLLRRAAAAAALLDELPHLGLVLVHELQGVGVLADVGAGPLPGEQDRQLGRELPRGRRRVQQPGVDLAELRLRAAVGPQGRLEPRGQRGHREGVQPPGEGVVVVAVVLVLQGLAVQLPHERQEVLGRGGLQRGQAVRQEALLGLRVQVLDVLLVVGDGEAPLDAALGRPAEGLVPPGEEDELLGDAAELGRVVVRVVDRRPQLRQLLRLPLLLLGLGLEGLGRVDRLVQLDEQAEPVPPLSCEYRGVDFRVAGDGVLHVLRVELETVGHGDPVVHPTPVSRWYSPPSVDPMTETRCGMTLASFSPALGFIGPPPYMTCLIWASASRPGGYLSMFSATVGAMKHESGRVALKISVTFSGVRRVPGAGAISCLAPHTTADMRLIMPPAWGIEVSSLLRADDGTDRSGLDTK
ncbi:hypothetical protein VPNG_04088 [Cytospora leucostoma]|uniref:Uncharacterized protein n=1 Tax=Cytospora leucostoma TaxID=1230097 RepID=A0A423XDG1_9PEZI|nr:hypothetical protein VPNG_04088 [Cytospora leucostoma]